MDKKNALEILDFLIYSFEVFRTRQIDNSSCSDKEYYDDAWKKLGEEMNLFRGAQKFIEDSLNA